MKSNPVSWSGLAEGAGTGGGAVEGADQEGDKSDSPKGSCTGAGAAPESALAEAAAVAFAVLPPLLLLFSLRDRALSKLVSERVVLDSRLEAGVAAAVGEGFTAKLPKSDPPTPEAFAGLGVAATG